MNRRSDAIRSLYGAGIVTLSSSRFPSTPNRSLIGTQTPPLASTAWTWALHRDRIAAEGQDLPSHSGDPGGRHGLCGQARRTLAGVDSPRTQPCPGDHRHRGLGADRGGTPTRPSAKDTDRPQLDELLRFIRRGDTMVVHSMDRLARNLATFEKCVGLDKPRCAGGIRQGTTRLHRRGDDSPMADLLLAALGVSPIPISPPFALADDGEVATAAPGRQ